MQTCSCKRPRPLGVDRALSLVRYGMQYHGQMALFTSVLVAFTQLIPEHQVQIFGFFKVRVKVTDILKVLWFR